MSRFAQFCVLCSLVFATGSTAQALDYSQTLPGSVAFPDSTPVVLTFTGASAASGDATLTLIATGGELANNNKRLEQLTVEGDTFQTPGSPAGWIRPVNFLDDLSAFPAPVTIPLAALSGYVADGQVAVSVVRPNFIAGGAFNLTLSYPLAVPEPSSILLGGLICGAFGVARSARRRRKGNRRGSA